MNRMRTRVYRKVTSRIFLACIISLAIPQSFGQTQTLDVVVSFSILADMTRKIGGENVTVYALVGPNEDAHVYQPSPADAVLLSDADLVIVNGLGFEGWIDRLIDAANYRGEIVVASAGVQVIGGSAHGDHYHGADPHAWQSLANARLYLRNIAAGLQSADASAAISYGTALAAYLQEVEFAEDEIRATLSRIPARSRKVITSHEAFAYYADAYGIAFLAPQGLSTDAEPSASDIAALIRQVRDENVGAVFLESISDPRLLTQIARETDALIGGTLFSDALSDESGPAATYLEMMRHNTRTIANALAPRGEP
jgi:zinc/manganese transport system substrate-binding protein